MRIKILGLIILIIFAYFANIKRGELAFGGEGILLVVYISWMIYSLVNNKE